MGSELVRRDYFRDLKSSSKISFSGKYYLVDKCIDECCLLIGVRSKYCKNFDLPIHFTCVESFGLKHNNYYYCCHDCMVGEEMKTDGRP